MSTVAETICREARRWNLRLEQRGDKVAIIPGSKAPPEFIEFVRANKAEVIAWLEADGLAPDQAPWLHVGKEVLLGEFSGADKSTLQSLEIGLRSIRHPTCENALARVREAMSTKEEKQ
jgi:hypothetical protein